jgi:hypothetical protein
MNHGMCWFYTPDGIKIRRTTGGSYREAEIHIPEKLFAEMVQGAIDNGVIHVNNEYVEVKTVVVKSVVHPGKAE